MAQDCAITDSEIEYSIVLRGALIQGVRRIEASLIGQLGADIELRLITAPYLPTELADAGRSRCRSTWP